MYQQRKFASVDSFVFHLPFFGCRYVANFDEMNGHALGYLITHEGLLCHRESLTIIVYCSGNNLFSLYFVYL